MAARKWDKHVDFIRAHAGRMTRAQIAESIGTTKSNLYNICHNYGIELPNESALRKSKQSKWLRVLPLIREKAGTLLAAEIAELVGTTRKNLYNICTRYGISLQRTTNEYQRHRAARLARMRSGDPFAGTKPRGGPHERR